MLLVFQCGFRIKLVEHMLSKTFFEGDGNDLVAADATAGEKVLVVGAATVLQVGWYLVVFLLCMITWTNKSGYE